MTNNEELERVNDDDDDGVMEAINLDLIAICCRMTNGKEIGETHN